MPLPTPNPNPKVVQSVSFLPSCSIDKGEKRFRVVRESKGESEEFELRVQWNGFDETPVKSFEPRFKYPIETRPLRYKKSKMYTNLERAVDSIPFAPLTNEDLSTGIENKNISEAEKITSEDEKLSLDVNCRKINLRQAIYRLRFNKKTNKDICYNCFRYRIKLEFMNQLCEEEFHRLNEILDNTPPKLKATLLLNYISASFPNSYLKI